MLRDSPSDDTSDDTSLLNERVTVTTQPASAANARGQSTPFTSRRVASK